MAPGSRQNRSGRRLARPAQPAAADPPTNAQVPVSYRMSKEVHTKLRAYCFVRGLSQNQFVTDAVQEKLKKVMASTPIADALLDVIGK